MQQISLKSDSQKSVYCKMHVANKLFFHNFMLIDYSYNIYLTICSTILWVKKKNDIILLSTTLPNINLL